MVETKRSSFRVQTNSKKKEFFPRPQHDLGVDHLKDITFDQSQSISDIQEGNIKIVVVKYHVSEPPYSPLGTPKTLGAIITGSQNPGVTPVLEASSMSFWAWVMGISLGLLVFYPTYAIIKYYYNSSEAFFNK